MKTLCKISFENILGAGQTPTVFKFILLFFLFFLLFMCVFEVIIIDYRV